MNYNSYSSNQGTLSIQATDRIQGGNHLLPATCHTAAQKTPGQVPAAAAAAAAQHQRCWGANATRKSLAPRLGAKYSSSLNASLVACATGNAQTMPFLQVSQMSARAPEKPAKSCKGTAHHTSALYQLLLWQRHTAPRRTASPPHYTALSAQGNLLLGQKPTAELFA